MEYSELFDKFQYMESSYSLFDIVEEGFIPLWDFIRVEIFNNEIARDKNLYLKKITCIEKLKNYLFYIYKGFFLPSRIDFAFIYCPRFLNASQKYYDRIAEDIIEYSKGSKCMYINVSGNYINMNIHDYSLFLFNIIAKIRIHKLKLSQKYYEIVSKAVSDVFGVNIAYDRINFLYRNKVRSYYAYYYYLKWMRPKKVFCSLDIQKGLYLAAKQLQIPTCEIQHGTLVYQYPSYSYPPFINHSSNIAFAEIFASPGDGWGPNNNIPCKERVVLGNSAFVVNSEEISDKGDIVIISSHVHYIYLVPFAIRLSQICNSKIIYKLHPNEYSNIEYYNDRFLNYSSIEIPPLSKTMSDILKDCSLVITISSTVFFEAKTMGKRIAILKADNYKIMEPYVSMSSNTCIIEKAEDVLDALKMPEHSDGVKYYKPFDKSVANRLLYH